MDNPIVISLAVSGIGMLMLFAALTFLYGLMYLMTWATNIRPSVTDRPTAKEAKGKEQDERRRKQRAAAIAVALARAGQDLGPVGAVGAQGATSAWRVLHHQRQLTRGASMGMGTRTRRAE
jgi:Na+-transporting methylmalonyl-CoA/oxaloacetate decarboxylase gamma subunit